ncbi:hypothetical protein FB565_001347 [Actinoplanes lutulentus]|uniref:Uncharacterized protein n=1 Tax=Actinoplanes lutulentus TaxID=1287878 RepID=A0A327ZFL2_9ACTN|nr:hypothetical protein [Actinoplanes lutulentus]RAK39563.1 hypothetical protein B0I29_104100 [Actinoplanes lutulentus]
MWSSGRRRRPSFKVPSSPVALRRPPCPRSCGVKAGAMPVWRQRPQARQVTVSSAAVPSPPPGRAVAQTCHGTAMTWLSDGSCFSAVVQPRYEARMTCLSYGSARLARRLGSPGGSARPAARLARRLGSPGGSARLVVACSVGGLVGDRFRVGPTSARHEGPACACRVGARIEPEIDTRQAICVVRVELGRVSNPKSTQGRRYALCVSSLGAYRTRNRHTRFGLGDRGPG